jgi:hypothetical protein
MNEIQAEGGRSIRVYDDVFDLTQVKDMYSFALNSMFKIGWADDGTLERLQYKSLFSDYSPEDLERLNLLPALQNSKAAAELVGHEVAHCKLNLSTPADVNFIHAHAEDRVLLMYLNPKWEEGYHGETLFLNQARKEVIYTSLFTPNRLVSFSGSVPHTIRPQSYLSPFYRFTLSLILKKTTDET